MTPAGVIEPEKILRELRELWTGLAQEQGSTGGVLRACAMTLIVVAEPDGDGRDAESARKTIGVLMHAHPSRAILISLREGGEFAARVFSECWMPFGGERQICAEGVEIGADSEQTDEVARLLVPLIAPDLPVVLWCRGPRAFLDRSLDPLFLLADKIIFDTGRVRNSISATEFLRRMCKGKSCVADLAWTRLTGWRESVAHLFESGSCGEIGAITGVRVAYGGPAGAYPPTMALYFARWVEKMLPSINVALLPVPGEAGLQSVVFAADTNETSMRRAQASALDVRTPSGSYTTPLPAATDEALMQEELSILGKDAVFQRMLA